ncbi:zinc finger CCCH-type with G patch domain-containing protein-like [Penaeus japonicus]|uniref:zinc finger CCCH-type with G patch domain-containing protein-like n=1 Tax=Penaeus japonicus TaxID=27405 RepID=UPI001C70E98B|nr:zinc finger CCCH-type with G patch domain-containing protein-like [Penaeus japonicus]
MATEELLASIEIYQNQLKDIEGALSSAEEAEKQQLQELQANLLQLLDLTLQQLSQQSQLKEEEPQQHTSGNRSSEEDFSQSASDKSGSSCSDKNLDDEFALFQSEIADITETTGEEEKTDSKYSKEELLAVEGTHCRAPFIEKWGGHTYHNAVVLNIVTQDGGDVDLNEPEVQVLFSQPTCREMLTCRFFLSGRCKYSDDKCRFSHGMKVPFCDIKEYREPDISILDSGSRVLVQHTDDLWTNATVQDILEDRSAFCVKIDHSKSVAEVKPNQIIPLHQGEEDSEKYEADNHSEDDSSDDERAVFIPTANWLQNSLSQQLGEWEKHTKGIASKLMAKMGYIIGTGLGPNGEGRVEPVSAYVYPQGVSLDGCMELREASNGEEMLQVEKRLDRQRRIEEAKSVQAAERLRARTSVFDIINKKLGTNGQETDDTDANPKQRLNVCKTVLQKDTNKDLNRKNYQLSENIRQLQRDITKLEGSRDRQSGNKAAADIISTKIQAKQSELQRARDAERKVQGEQQSRRDAKKYSVF